MTSFLGEVVGHDGVKQGLLRLLAGGRVPGALLLVGEEGRGKTTLAVAFARALLAGDVAGLVDPAAGAARMFDAGQHGDFFLLQPQGSKRLLGVETVRELKRRFSLTAVEGGARVAVVAGADRLTLEAANALLKILEEPPPGAHLVLTSAGRESVLETILSRCLVLPVPPLSDEALEALLLAQGICPERIPLLVLVAAGRPGRALTMARQTLDLELLLPGAGLIFSRGAPVKRGALLAGLVRAEGSSPEAARQRLALVLDLAGRVLEEDLRAVLGGGPGRQTLRDLLELPPPSLPASALERHLHQVLSMLRDLEKNVALDLIIEERLLDWECELATIC